ncbi:ATXN2_2L [Lepeophtheirus salmonis]|uniref:ATXN2_2L n=1 Tax=Lepeophtheirus salmonis TaxID=72036 RepID=A0A7R8H3I8_LEPSM|nr:ATXN2_2L [Lepeophtheirus salmonis]CAF2830719.1 ATXN2_2L [Lepeophtheirus salmonis]
MSCEKGKSRTEGPKNLKLLGNEFGLWKNSRFAHTVSSLVGVNVCVETANDGTYEGILRTISRFLDVVLLDSHLVDEKNCEDIRADTLVEKRVFEAKDIVRLVALDVDLEYATKKAFQTDHQISGKSNGPMRELEEWKPEDGDCQELEGGLETSNNGWKPEEMFAKNEQNYGVKSTYKDNLEGYTCQLNSEGKDSAEYKQREAKAAEIARQIESNASSLSAVDLENGENENEEEAFSAVVRSASPPPSSQPQRVSNSYHRSNRESSSEEPSSSSNNSNNAANNNIVKNNKESPESKKKGSPVVTPSPELAVEKVEENEVIESSKRGPSPETKPRVHFSDQSPSNVALTTAASTAPSTTIPTTSSPSTKKSGLNPNAKEFFSKSKCQNVHVEFVSTSNVYYAFETSNPQQLLGQRDYPRPELTSPIQTQSAVAGTPHHHHQQHGVVMRMSGVLPHNFALAGASSLEPLNLGQSPGQQNQWTTAAVTTSQGPPPQQGNPQQPLTGTPPAPSHNPSPGPQVLFPLAMTQHQQHSQGNNQAPPVNSLAYTHHHHHHPSNAATFAATASHGSGHYPPNLLALPHTAQGHVHGGVPLTTYIAPPTAVPGHQNHLLHSHLTQ